tara:strand:+ start:486 stop:878 length:393 start_codon:yes stop_codon:yes gene_type:complete
MKNPLIVFAVGIYLVSCGDNSIDIDALYIDVHELTSSCDCIEARIAVTDVFIAQQKDVRDRAKNMGYQTRKERASAHQINRDLHELIQNKYAEINEKCIGDLAPENADEDCEAVILLDQKRKEAYDAVNY